MTIFKEEKSKLLVEMLYLKILIFSVEIIK